jgi:hypothetical protein
MKMSDAEVQTELAYISRNLDRWAMETTDTTELQEISKLRERIAAFKKHLGIDKKIAV